MTAAELAEKLEDIAGYRDIVLKHRKITDDKKITYVLKDGTRIHEDESVIAKLAASLTAALESAAETATEAAARLRSMEEALSREERAHEQTVDERDIAQATADRLADLIAQITGVEIGEHRAGLGCPGNDPHLNAIDAAEGFLHARAALSGEGQ